MGTSRSDPPDLSGLRVPDTATDEEAAAVAAAIGTYLSRERADDGDERDLPWTGRRWSFASRLDSLGLDATRVPDGAPDSGWAAAGRADRF